MNECFRPFRLAPALSLSASLAAFSAVATAAVGPAPLSHDDQALAQFQKTILPILKDNCYDCHGDGSAKAGIAFDELTTKDQILHNPALWFKVLRNTRSRIMPPPDGPAPTPAQQLALEEWIKTAALGLDARQPDPGRVTMRRLNRTEYHNTLRDLIGVDFDAEAALPPDDVGYGFDNIGDVMSISPMRMEKLIEAAMSAADKGVPMDTVAISAQMALPKEFLSDEPGKTGDNLSFYRVKKVSHLFHAKAAGDYRLHLAVKVDGDARPDPQRCRIHVFAGDKEVFTQEYHWSDADYFDYDVVAHLEAGDQEVSFVTEPVDPSLKPLPSKMDFRILYVRFEGPLDRKHWEHPANYALFYPRETPPTDAAGRRAYAREVLGRFVARAYRRPVVDNTVDQLVALAEKTYSVPGVPFEKGIAQAIIAVLSSPRFLFHLETAEPVAPGQAYPRVDEYTLASRLSYALWSSMPDEELTNLAARGELRKNFHAQVQRMLADPKGQAFAVNFSGQWLQSRGVLELPINSADIMALEADPAATPAPVIANAPAAPAVEADAAAGTPAPAAPTPAPAPVVAVAPAAAPTAPLVGEVVAANQPAAPAAGGAPRGGAAAGRGGVVRGRGRGPSVPSGTVLTPEVRVAMKQETDAYFNYVATNNRSILELLQSDYTFVNETLAPVYGIPNITGQEMRRVTLPPGDLRGGVLTMGSVLTVTSNPTRTSPVKRGKWILENILGAPPPPPPPNIPALEDTQAKITDRKPSQRELLAIHRADPKCATCHARMDPIGLAMESFNGFGRVRVRENGQPIEPAGELATGEKFSDVRDLKRALVDRHRLEFYRTITEKLLTYVLGRGVEYYDVMTVDQIVERLEKDEGHFSTLLFGVLDSAPFQQRRVAPHGVTGEVLPVSSATQVSLSP